MVLYEHGEGQMRAEMRRPVFTSSRTADVILRTGLQLLSPDFDP